MEDPFGMAARDRDSTLRSPSSESRMTYTEFLRLFPDNTACLDYLKAKFYADGTECPSCGKPSKFHRIKGRSAYSCQYCRHQVYPTAGTIMHKSTTSLQLWFWAIYLMSSTRCGISAKQLEREIGITYKTAHRMFKQIRSLLQDEDDTPLSGEVEVDETAYGGKPRAAITRKGREAAAEHAQAKPTVMGMVERGGRVKATVVPDRSHQTLVGEVYEHVLPDTMIYTDEYNAYTGLDRQFVHRRIPHQARIYVRGDVHTNSVEGFFGLLKNGIRGVYHSVSHAYLQAYLDEYAWRCNHRFDDRPMFWTILEQVKKPSPAPAS
jgi:transposase-like protein